MSLKLNIEELFEMIDGQINRNLKMLTLRTILFDIVVRKLMRVKWDRVARQKNGSFLIEFNLRDKKDISLENMNLLKEVVETVREEIQTIIDCGLNIYYCLEGVGNKKNARIHFGCLFYKK